VALGDERHDVAHDLRQVEVLGGVDRGHAGRPQQLDVGLGDDPADDDGHVDTAVAQRLHDRRDEFSVRAREDRQAHHVDALLERAGGDLRRRQPDALVDDVHADVAGAHGDLLGPVGMPVEARLAHEDLQPPPDRLAHPVDLLAQLLERRRVAGPGRGLAHAGGSAELAEGSAQGVGPLAGGGARARGGQRRLHDVALARSHLAQRGERGVDRRLVALGAPARDRRALLLLGRRVDREDAAVGPGQQRRGLGLGEAVDADDDQIARLDAADPVAVGLDQRGLHVVHRFDRAAVLGHDRHLRPGALEQLRHQPVHDLRALEEVGVLEQVGLVGQHLLDAQRPLLVPRARQPERLVPGRQLDRARPRGAPERHGQRLEHDALRVVLGL
jgi:hypothetical protein